MEKPCYAFIPILPWWKVKYHEIKWAYTDEKTRVYMIKLQLSKPSTQVQNVKGNKCWNWARQLFHFVIYGFSTFKVHAIIRVPLTRSTTSSCSVHMHGLQSFFQPTRILYIHAFLPAGSRSVSQLTGKGWMRSFKLQQAYNISHSSANTGAASARWVK